MRPVGSKAAHSGLSRRPDCYEEQVRVPRQCLVIRVPLGAVNFACAKPTPVLLHRLSHQGSYPTPCSCRPAANQPAQGGRAGGPAGNPTRCQSLMLCRVSAPKVDPNPAKVCGIYSYGIRALAHADRVIWHRIRWPRHGWIVSYSLIKRHRKKLFRPRIVPRDQETNSHADAWYLRKSSRLGVHS